MATSEKIEISLEELKAEAKEYREKLRERLYASILTIEETKHFACLGEINVKRYQTKNENETDNQ